MAGNRGATIWLTGLPCSGKSTIAAELGSRLLARGERCEILDGDSIRKHLTSGLGFSREDRLENVRRVAYVANLLARNGVRVIVALVSPYRASREEAREVLNPLLEVYVSCPLAECERRDVKGMYRRARAGQLPNFTGIDDPYEPPLAADVTLRTDLQSPGACAQALEDALLARNLLDFANTAPASTGTGG
jgi:adenylyl-sulfate kinase